MLNPQLLPHAEKVALNPDPHWELNAALLSLAPTRAIGVDLESLPIEPDLVCEWWNLDYHAPTVEEKTGLKN